jgi:hypothetical protein
MVLQRIGGHSSSRAGLTQGNLANKSIGKMRDQQILSNGSVNTTSNTTFSNTTNSTVGATDKNNAANNAFDQLKRYIWIAIWKIVLHQTAEKWYLCLFVRQIASYDKT